MKLTLRAVVNRNLALRALALSAIVHWTSGSLLDVFNRCCDIGHEWFDVNHESCPGYTSSFNGIRPSDRAACNTLIQICCLNKRQQSQCTEGKDLAKTGDDCDEWLSQLGSEDARICCKCCDLGITANQAGLSCTDFEDQLEPICYAAFQDCCESGSRDLPSTPSTPIVSSNASSSQRCSSNNRCEQRCTDSGQTVQCSCFDGYTLDQDERSCNDVNECIGRRVCGPGQVCVNTQGSYRCQGEVSDEGPVDEHEASTPSVDEPGPHLNCGTGFTYDRRSGQCEDINECAMNHDTCVEGQTCENTVGSFMCRRTLSCGTGYTLDQTSQNCIDDDECRLETHNCGVGRVCMNIPGSFRCVTRTCPRGYQVDFRTGNCNPIICPRGLRADEIGNCVDIDECLERRPNACQSNQECRNTIGSYMCRSRLICSSGYKLNEAGTRCEDIDECQTGTHECHGTMMQCVNRPGTYSCQCPEGYQINHALRICEDLDECHYSGHVCAQNARCENTYGSYRCNCKDGFAAGQNGRVCNDIDECQQSGMCQQTCQNTWGSFHCLCEEGYRLASDRRSCDDVDECQQAAKLGIQICIGLCENTYGSFTCACPSGYQLNSDGQTCQDINECAMQTANCAHHDDVCINTRGGYRCQSVTCPNGFTKSPLTGSRNSNVKCQRKTFICAQGDLECLYAPLSYSTNFITFPMQIRTPADLFTMRGPMSSYRRLSFDLKLISARDPRTGEARVDRGFFALHQLRSNEAVVQLLREIPGPQDIELQLDMSIYSKEFGQNTEEIFFGTAVARIFIYVTKDGW